VRIDVFTLFPEMIEGYVDQSILGRASREHLLDVAAIDLRSGATDDRRTVDDTPFGGGAGMVLMAEPVIRAIEERESSHGKPGPLIALVPHGRRFDQAEAARLSALDGFSLLCGRYEGIDQRVLDGPVDDVLSIGDFVLAGGELAALVVIEAVARLCPGVLGNETSITEESFSSGLLEYPQWTKPAAFRGHEVPAILRSGDHGRIAHWRHVESLRRTIELRPDLIQARGGLTEQEQRDLEEHLRMESTGETG